jgi:hypothetical protein
VSISHYIKIHLQTPKLVRDIETKIPLEIGYAAQTATLVATTPPEAPTSAAPRDAILFATAVALPVDTMEAPTTVAPAHAIVLGGVATADDCNTESF